MTASLALLLAVAAPLLQAVLVSVFKRPPGLRDTLHVGLSLASAGAALVVFAAAARGEAARIVLAQPLPHVDLALMAEPIGALAGVLIAGLNCLHAVHGAGLARRQEEADPQALMAFSAVSAGMALASVYAANVLTFFAAFLVLTLCAYPLAQREPDESARNAAGGYLAMVLTASFALLLPAMVWLYSIASTLEFQRGGLLAGRVDPWSANALLALFVLGIGQAALAPTRSRLGAGRPADAQYFALTHCIAVTPAVGAGLIKVVAYVFGAAIADAAWVAQGLLLAVGVAACGCALVALSRQEVHERIAYALLAQTLLVVGGALLGSPAGMFGAVLQLLAASCAAATMLMAAGAVMVATGRRNAAEFVGLGKLMPWMIAAFALAAATLIGMPPFAGAWAKLSLISAAAHVGEVWLAILTAAAAVLSFAPLGPLAANALAGETPPDAFKRPDGAPLMVVAPSALGAAATLWLVFLADRLFAFLAPVWTGGA